MVVGVGGMKVEERFGVCNYGGEWTSSGVPLHLQKDLGEMGKFAQTPSNYPVYDNRERFRLVFYV